MGRIHIYYLTTFCLFWISPLTSSLPTVDPIGDDKSLQVLSVISLQPREDDESGALERRANAAIATAVPAPGQQVQNMTSTMGVNSTDPPPGFIPNSPDTYEQINCTNLRSGRDNKCWDELDLTNWVNKWIASNQCRQNEPLASCFLRKEGFYGLDCTGVKLAACTAPQSDSLDVKPEVFYVAYNIYAINQFFLSWWTAVGNAAQTASLNIDEIVQLVNPKDNTNVIMGDILIALTGLFAILPIPLGFARAALDVGNTWKTTAHLVENALFAYPQIGRYLFPDGTTESQLIQMARLKTDLVGIIGQVQNNLNKTLVSVMSNKDEFLAFASQGNFTASAPSIPDQTNYLLYAFNTYIITAALNGNDVHSVMAKDTNPQQLATNASSKHLNYKIDCQEYNEQGVCDAWWYSENYNIAFGLNDFKKQNRNFHDIITKLLSTLTTGELLFEASLACNSQGGYGAPVNVTVNAEGVNTACLSQLKTETWDMGCTKASHSGKCEFLESPKQNQFLASCGSHSMHSVMDEPQYCVPHAYLGPLITQKKKKLRRN